MNILHNKVAIITGASSGIGKAIAMELASYSSNVVIVARRSEELNKLAMEIKLKYDLHCLAIIADVSIPSDCERIISLTIEKYKRIDILINNAGVSQRALFKDLNLEVIHRIMNINYWGTVYCTKYALPYILDSKGSIVAVSSISGYSPLPGRTGYCSSKYAIHGFIETLRIELLKTGVHVMLATPGFTTSEIRKNALLEDGSAQGETPRKEENMMSPEKVAQLIVKGLIKRKRNLIISMHGKIIVFLTRFFPTFTDRLIYKHMAKEANSPLK